MSVKAGALPWYALERVLAGLAALICLGVTVLVWAAIGAQQTLWPLPALYFLEMAAASLLGLWGIYRNDAAGSRLAWAATGALFGFMFLGALSVGFFYMPVAGLLGLAALWQDRDDLLHRLPLHLGLAVLVMAAQTVLMLGLIRLLNPGAAF